MLRPLLATIALLLTAQAPPPPVLAPPVLAPYVAGETFAPGDYGWMRRRFDDAGAADKAAWAGVQDWLTACRAGRRAVVMAELQGLGIAAPVLDQTPLMAPLCAQVVSATPDVPTRRFAEFGATLATARPIADAFLYAVAGAQDASGNGSTLSKALIGRPVAEQMLRTALGWGEGAQADAPPLTPAQKPIVLAALGAALARIDHANTEWLKREVADGGWPSSRRVGERSATMAWLLVQHADADPAFQLRMLRLMAPLQATGEVSGSDHAYLYDRVMLKLVGQQRYGTQMACVGGVRGPRPLADGKVDEWRRAAKLTPLAQYLAGMNGRYGPCPPAPPGR